MPASPPRFGQIDAIVFDVGNTLVPWGTRESTLLYAALQEDFERACGPMPDFFERASAVRAALIKEREETSMREITIEELVRGICGGDVPDGLCAAIEHTTDRVFEDGLCRVPDGTRDILARLGEDRPLAILSNFYMSRPIERALERAQLTDLFKHIEVSATSGFAKPHPALFDTVREHLDVPMERILMVGDEFWADIVGGHRAGFLTALTHEHYRGPTQDPRTPSIAPDAVISSLGELL